MLLYGVLLAVILMRIAAEGRNVPIIAEDGAPLHLVLLNLEPGNPTYVRGNVINVSDAPIDISDAELVFTDSAGDTYISPPGPSEAAVPLGPHNGLTYKEQLEVLNDATIISVALRKAGAIVVELRLDNH